MAKSVAKNQQKCSNVQILRLNSKIHTGTIQSYLISIMKLFFFYQ